jgi:hypothetical protein
MPDPTDQELDDAMAEMMGWTRRGAEYFLIRARPKSNESRVLWATDWHPSTNIAQAFECQNALPEELREAYYRRLYHLVEPVSLEKHKGLAGLSLLAAMDVEMLFATARQRCLAMYRAVKESE